MNRCVKVLAVALLCASARAQVADQVYESATITVQLVEQEPGITAVLLTEHGDADYVIVEAFYWATFHDQRLLIHKEAATPLVKERGVTAELPMAVSSIVFLKVKEMKLLKESKFGKEPR